MLPYVLDETVVRFFNYWDHEVRSGMQHGHELYTHVQSYSLTQRNNAYTLAFDHMEEGYQVCITVSKQGYGVWKSLRSTAPQTRDQKLKVHAHSIPSV